MIWATILVIVAVVVILPFAFEAQRMQINDDMRRRSSGRFSGPTHFRWHGPENGPVIVAVHGLTTPSIVWHGVIPHLTSQGFRVLAYDLPGRGFSDVAHGPHSIGILCDQLRDLLLTQKITQPVVLLGYSMGASIVTAYAAAHRDQVRSVLLLAPAGVVMREALFDRLCRILPGTGDWMHAAFAAGRARRGSQKPAEIAQMQTFQLARRGYLPAVLASRRGALTEILEREHRILAKQKVPVGAIWAEMDSVIPLVAMGQLAAWNGAAHHDCVAGASHGVPYTHPDAVAVAILAMLAVHDQIS
jgi:pimeloyl-ACP methyl ester carboxylesterase